MIVVLSEDNILTKFRANPMHVVHVVHVHEYARGEILAIFEVETCRSVFDGKDNILTKFRANPMHLVHVVHVHEYARGQIWAIFPNFQGY